MRSEIQNNLLKRAVPIVLFSLNLALINGCSVFLGNVKPADDKSDSYGVMDLSKENPDWVKLDPVAEGEDKKNPAATQTGVPDVAFQSKATGSVISLDSACRETSEGEKQKQLREITNLLFLGISDITLSDEVNLTIQGAPALQTTVQGKLNGDDTKLRSVVLRRGNCTYDLVYVTRPSQFEAREGDFSRFVSSLKLK